MNSNVHGKRNTARPASVSSLAPRFTGSTLKGKKSRAALALVVSLWIANGGVASAAAIENWCLIDWHAGATQYQMVSSPALSEGLQGTVTDNKCLSVGVLPDFSGSSVTMPDTLAACFITNENVYSSTTGNTSVYGYTVNLTGKNGVSFNTLQAIYGAELGRSNSTYSVTNNSVNLQNVAFATSDQIEVFGGDTSGTGAASNNTVAISGSSFSAKAMIIGGESDNGNASGNTVTIADSEFKNNGKIYAAYAAKVEKTSENNTLNLYGSVKGLTWGSLYGR